MNGAEYIVEFLSRRGCKQVFLVTGGACAFIVDAIGRHKTMKYVCFQHEQAAAMAADAQWRMDKTVGVTVVTSGPGATNLITGIACSFFDSIPIIHITGQVNKAESAAYLGAKVRQAGFQETSIVDVVKPITKYAVQVDSASQLRQELTRAYNIAITGRMGPVLIDVPMNVQQEAAGEFIEYSETESHTDDLGLELRTAVQRELHDVFAHAERPLILFGAGVGLARVEDDVIKWIERNNLKFVSSWNGLSYFNHDSKSYCGHIGVYGNRGANYIVQNCDSLLVLGSRLDNRQRSGNSSSFAPKAHVHVVDIDEEELKKYTTNGYSTTVLDLKSLPLVLEGFHVFNGNQEWLKYVDEMKCRWFGKDISTHALKTNSISPYEVVQRVNQLIRPDAVVVADCGANLCWVYQIFHRTQQKLFTAGGNSPMGYSLPAAIGAALNDRSRQIVCFIGDGGCQMNIQELQTIKHYDLNIKIMLLNNFGYGIIKQFQDSYLNGRYFASGEGYSVPNFQRIAEAYGICYSKINNIDQITSELLNAGGSALIDVTLDGHTLIEPRMEMGRPINDQFPYVSDEEFASANRFVNFQRKPIG